MRGVLRHRRAVAGQHGTFAGSGDAFGSGGRYQACIHLRPEGGDPVLLDCGATSLSALKRLGLDPGEIAAVFVSHLHGDHFGGLPFLILDGQFSRRTKPLTIVAPPGISRRLSDTMECLFPGSSGVSRQFAVDVIELAPGSHRHCVRRNSPGMGGRSPERRAAAYPPPQPGQAGHRLHGRHRVD